MDKFRMHTNSGNPMPSGWSSAAVSGRSAAITW